VMGGLIQCPPQTAPQLPRLTQVLDPRAAL
jgi:hypothetical protein